MKQQVQTGNDDAWSYIETEDLGEKVLLRQIIIIDDGRYLVVGKFKKSLHKDMSSIAMYRMELNDKVFILCSLHKSYFEMVKIEKLLTAQDFEQYLARIDKSIKNHRDYFVKELKPRN